MLYHNDPINLIIKKEKLNKKYPLLFEDKLSILKNNDSQIKTEKMKKVYFENKQFNKTLLYINNQKENLIKHMLKDKEKLIINDYHKRILSFKGSLSSNSSFYSERKGKNGRRLVINPIYHVEDIKIFDYKRSKVDEYYKIIQTIDESKFYNKIGGFDYFCCLKKKYLRRSSVSQ